MKGDELNNEIDQFMLHHNLTIRIRNKETNIVAPNRYPPQHDESLGPHHEESREFMTENALNFVRLFDPDGETDGVDGGFDQDAFGGVSGDEERREEDFWR